MKMNKNGFYLYKNKMKMGAGLQVNKYFKSMQMSFCDLLDV